MLQLDALAKGYHPMLMGSKFTVDAPTAIGGLGGSGTRVFAALLQEAGIYIGDCLNEPLDNLWFTVLIKRSVLDKTDCNIYACCACAPPISRASPSSASPNILTSRSAVAAIVAAAARAWGGSATIGETACARRVSFGGTTDDPFARTARMCCGPAIFRRSLMSRTSCSLVLPKISRLDPS